MFKVLILSGGCFFVVMGKEWGDSRFRELVFGGVSLGFFSS